MENQIKFSGWIKAYRRKLKQFQFLTDQEYRLLDVLSLIVDWDIGHTSTFGTTAESLRDIHRHYLPSWSVAKIQKIMASLIQKNLIQRRLGGRVEVNGFKQLVDFGAESVQPNGQTVQLNERDVPPIGQAVQPVEQSPKNDFYEGEDVMPVNTGQRPSTVQSVEQPAVPKQTLNNLKEPSNNDEMLLIKGWMEKYTHDVEIPLKRYGFPQVREAVRIMEARIEAGEVVRNYVGCITNLCKTGARWEGSEWQLKEAEREADRQADKQKWEDMTKSQTPEEHAKSLAALDKLKKNLSGKLGWK